MPINQPGWFRRGSSEDIVDLSSYDVPDVHAENPAPSRAERLAVRIAEAGSRREAQQSPEESEQKIAGERSHEDMKAEAEATIVTKLLAGMRREDLLETLQGQLEETEMLLADLQEEAEDPSRESVQTTIKNTRLDRQKLLWQIAFVKNGMKRKKAA